MKGRQIFSNYKLNMPHTLVINPDDIVNMREGFLAADELWTI